MGERRQFRTLAQGFAVASGLGTTFAIAVAAGVLGGKAIDEALGWRPIAFTLGLGLLGGAAGTLAIVRTLQAFERAEKRQQRETDDGDVDREQGSKPGREPR
jgi:F0F1-type ATP synthase assembly protein I